MSVEGIDTTSAMSSTLAKQRERILMNQRARRRNSAGRMMQGGIASPRKSTSRGGRRIPSHGGESSTDPDPPVPSAATKRSTPELEEIAISWQPSGRVLHASVPEVQPDEAENEEDGHDTMIHDPLTPMRSSDDSDERGPTDSQITLAQKLDEAAVPVVYRPSTDDENAVLEPASDFYNKKASPQNERTSVSEHTVATESRALDPPGDTTEETVSVRPEASAPRSAEALRNELIFDEEGYPSHFDFVYRPTPEGLTVQCEISRSKARKSTYILKLERPGPGGVKKVFLLAGKKRSFPGAKSIYLISIDPTDMTKESEAYCAKLKSNVLGTEFSIYDSGVNPKKALKGKDPTKKDIRREFGLIKYDRNIFGWGGPRQMNILVPALDDQQKPYVVQPQSHRDTIATKCEQGRTSDLLHFTNKSPIWKDKSSGAYQVPSQAAPKGSYVLDFKGRVTEPSIKNFQLVFGDDLDYIVCQFGRTGKDSFAMDVQYPMSIVQAFAICLSSFDFKPGCE